MKKPSKLLPKAIAISYGYGTEDNFLFNDKDYTYDTRFMRVSFYYALNRKKYELGLSLQPQVHFIQHQLLNEFFIQPHEENFEALRAQFAQPKNMRLYAIQAEVSIRKKMGRKWEAVLFGSIGPGYVNTETERLSKGFTFVENLGLELNYFLTKQWFLTFKPNYNHVSNGNLQKRNSGYNALNLEFGIGLAI